MELKEKRRRVNRRTSKADVPADLRYPGEFVPYDLPPLVFPEENIELGPLHPLETQQTPDHGHLNRLDHIVNRFRRLKEIVDFPAEVHHVVSRKHLSPGSLACRYRILFRLLLELDMTDASTGDNKRTDERWLYEQKWAIKAY
jgi:hypothetical protein